MYMNPFSSYYFEELLFDEGSKMKNQYGILLGSNAYLAYYGYLIEMILLVTKYTYINNISLITFSYLDSIIFFKLLFIFYFDNLIYG